MSRPEKGLVLGAALLLLAAADVFADEPAALRGIEEVIVTAERRSESINDVPLTVSAFSGGTMDELGIDGTEDIGRIVPGFVASNSGYSIPVYTLRGVGFVDISYSSTGTVGVYVDEVALPYSIMTKGALLDLERVEVLKGPQGTLYGRNSTGGTINYIARKPTNELDAGLTLGLSRFATFDASGFVSGPLFEDLAGRVAMKSTVSSEGWQISQTRPDDRLGEFNKHAGRGLLEWTPTDDLLVRLSASGWVDKSHAQAPFAVDFRPQNSFTGAVSLPIFFDNVIIRSGLPANAFDSLLASLGPLATAEFAGTADPAVAGHPFIPDNDDPQLADWAPDFPWRLNDSYWDVSLRAEFSITEEMTATGIFSYGRFESNESGLPQGGVSVLQSDQIVTATLQAIGAEARVDGRLGESIDWLVGFSASVDDTDEFHEAYATKNSFNFGPPLVGNPIGIPLLFEKAAQIASTTGESYGGFATLHWRITDAWGLTQGFRYTDELRTYEGCTLEPVDSRGVIGLTNVLNGLSLAGGGLGGAQKGDCFTLDPESNPRLFEGELGEDNVSTRTALEWSPTAESLFYLSYTRGYKAGNFPVVIATSHSAFEPATQERLVGYEGGAKATLLDG
ncbi:MAG: TonB-dependent receptor, partial [Candidatus Binatia bacterium]